MKHERFHYRSLEEVRARAAELGVTLPFAENTDALKRPLDLGGGILMDSRIGTAPMEGADSLPDGSPSEYTRRRYVRLAEGGSALLWFEAISIAEEGRSSASQLLITKDNLESYKRLTDAVKSYLEIADVETQFHTAVQLTVREYVSGMTLDELLANRDIGGRVS